MRPIRRFLDLIKTELPLLLAPMAGPGTVELAIAVSDAGGLGSLPCAMSTEEQIRQDVAAMRRGTSKPFNLNFFCHTTPAADPAREEAWRHKLALYYRELGLDPAATVKGGERRPFDSTMCALVEELRPAVVSFHFGLPETALLVRVKQAGVVVLSSATTVAEARWLAAQGCDAVIAQGYEAGGHRGMFLTDQVAQQPGTFALVPQVADAVTIPVVAAGGIGDARGIVAAFALGASAVQIGTAYLLCPEARLHPAHRAALTEATDDSTAVTNVFSGRAARGIVNRLMRETGPLAEGVPPFPLAAAAISPLRNAAERAGSVDYTPMWAGQAASLGRPLPAAEVTRLLIEEARDLLSKAGPW